MKSRVKCNQFSFHCIIYLSIYVIQCKKNYVRIRERERENTNRIKKAYLYKFSFLQYDVFTRKLTEMIYLYLRKILYIHMDILFFIIHNV